MFLSGTEKRRLWTYTMASWEDLVPTRLPPPQREHLHLLSVPCCHGYRVKHFCEAWPAELWLLFNTAATCPERSALIPGQWTHLICIQVQCRQKTQSNNNRIKQKLGSNEVIFFHQIAFCSLYFRHRQKEKLKTVAFTQCFDSQSGVRGLGPQS